MDLALSNCFYCSLPISGRPLTARVGGETQSFCCHGCLIVFHLMGRRGEPGQASLALTRLVAGGVLAMVVMAISWSTYLDSLVGGLGDTGGTGQTNFLLFRVYLPLAATIAILILGQPIVLGALAGFRRRRLDLNNLIALGVSGAYLLSLVSTITGSGQAFYDTAVALLFFVTLGRYLESRAKAMAAAEMRSLVSLIPQRATRLRDGLEEQVDPACLAVGDKVRVAAGEAFPADGCVVAGEGGVNEAALTGEELPVLKSLGDAVLAGTVNVDGLFTVTVDRTRDRTVISQVARLMEEARNGRGPMVRLSDRLAAILTPAAVALAIGAFAYWTHAGGPSRGLMVALAVLLIACPCSLGLATPLAIWIGLAEASRRGVLIRSGEVLERLGKVQHVFLDKTGTITTGSLLLSEIVPVRSWEGREAELLTLAISLARCAVHPMTRAISECPEAVQTAPIAVENVRYRPGMGVEGSIDGRQVIMGSHRLAESMGVRLEEDLVKQADRRASLAQSVSYLCLDGSAAGLLCFKARLREDAREAAHQFARFGRRVSLLTGDGEAQACWVARQLGIDDHRWGLSPRDKVAAVSQARADGTKVMMVGDGINDAPALATADVGVALASGADLARQAADVSFIGSNLVSVSWSLDLARRVRRTVFGNLAWGLLYNAVGLTIACLGFLAPWMSAIIMVANSLFVVGNSLRLRRGGLT